MTSVLTLGVAVDIRNHVVARLAGQGHLIECRTESELVDCAGGYTRAVVLVDVGGNNLPSAAMVCALRRIARTMPGLSIVAQVTLGRCTASVIRRLSHAGVGTIVLPPLEDAASAVARAIRQSLAERAARKIDRSLRSSMTPKALRIVRCCLRNAHGRLTVTQLAVKLGTSHRTLLRQCAAAGLPTPEELITRCRLLMTVEVSRSSRVSMERASRFFGFVDSSDLRTKLKRHLGATLRQVRLTQSCLQLLTHDTAVKWADHAASEPNQKIGDQESQRRPVAESTSKTAKWVAHMATGVADIATGEAVLETQS